MLAELARTKGTISSWAGSIRSSIGGAFSGLGSLAAGGISAAVGAVVGVIHGAMDKLGELGRVNRRATALGIDPSQFHGLSMVLQRAGIDANQAGNFFGHLNASILRAAQTGAGPAARALEALGLDAQKLAGSSGDEQLLALADAFQKLGPGATSAGIAMRMFGTTDILPILLRGREGIEGMIQAGRDSGAVLSNEQLQAAENASKAWAGAKRALSQAWEGISNTLIMAIAPALEAVGNFAARAVTFAMPFFKGLGEVFVTLAEIGTAVFEVIGEAISGVVDWVKAAWISVMGVTNYFPSVREIVVGVFRAITLAGAYCWDTLKVGLGAFVFGLSVIPQLFAIILDGIKWVVDVAMLLPDAIRPAWVDSFSAAVGRGAEACRRSANTMREWGGTAVRSFGDTAVAANRMFDGILARSRRTTRESRSIAQAVPPGRPQVERQRQEREQKYENAAIEAGSKEAYSAQVQFQMGTLMRDEAQQMERLNVGTERNGQTLEQIRDLLQQRGDMDIEGI